jgi:exonuclease V gamma subunit
LDVQFDDIEVGALSEYLPREVKIGSGSLPPLVLSGVVDEIYGDVHLEVSYGRMHARRKVGFWIEHLAACCARGDRSVQSVMVVRGGPREADKVDTFALRPVPANTARRILGRLVGLAQLGLSVPLPFFGEASEAYFDAVTAPPKKLLQENPEEVVPRALSAAREALQPTNFWQAPDQAVLEVYRGRDPLGELDASGLRLVPREDLAQLPFARLAELVLSPLASAQDGGNK